MLYLLIVSINSIVSILRTLNRFCKKTDRNFPNSCMINNIQIKIWVVYSLSVLCCFKFTSALEEALEKGLVTLPSAIQDHYPETCKVFRKVKDATTLQKTDFLSQIEVSRLPGHNSYQKISIYDIENYSCSFFSDLASLYMLFSLPPHNKKIVSGTLREEFGQILQEQNTTHIQCWLYDDADLATIFKVEKE